MTGMGGGIESSRTTRGLEEEVSLEVEEEEGVWTVEGEVLDTKEATGSLCMEEGLCTGRGGCSFMLDDEELEGCSRDDDDDVVLKG